MFNLLSNLDNCIPIMWRKILFTFRTLSVDLHKLDNLGLFDLYFIIDVFSDIDFYIEPFWMGFGPYKFRIEEMNFVKPLDFFQKNFKHLLAFSMAIYPRRSFEPFTKSTIFYLVTCCKQFILIHWGQSAGLANIAKLRNEFRAA